MENQMEILDDVYINKRIHRAFYAELDAECERVLAEGGFKGEISKEALAAAGYTIVHIDHSVTICKDGKQVSKTIIKPFV